MNTQEIRQYILDQRKQGPPDSQIYDAINKLTKPKLIYISSNPLYI